MQRISARFLQTVIVLIGMGALTFMLWMPLVEGRNAHATLFQVYFKDPFLAYAYIASIPFFTVLFHAFRLVGFAGRDTLFSQNSVKALRTMKFCALAMIGFVVGGEIFILLQESDDRAGGVFMGVLISFGASLIGATATLFEQVVQKALGAGSNRHP